MGYTVRQLGEILDAVGTSEAYACAGALRFRWTVSVTRDTATDVRVQVYTSVDGGTTYGLIQSQAIAAGVATLSDYTQVNAISGDEDFDGWVDILGATHVKLVLSATGATDDTFSVLASLTQVK